MKCDHSKVLNSNWLIMINITLFLTSKKKKVLNYRLILLHLKIGVTFNIGYHFTFKSYHI